jgi:hypothetical protein
MHKILLLLEFDREIAATRQVLKRVPDLPGLRPHLKSVASGKLAMRIATLPRLGKLILTEPSFDLTGPNARRSEYHSENRDQLVRIFDENAGLLREALAASTEESLQQTWSLIAGERVLLKRPRHLVYRQMFLNRFVNHRTQFAAYLRRNGMPGSSSHFAESAPFYDAPFVFDLDASSGSVNLNAHHIRNVAASAVACCA